MRIASIVLFTLGMIMVLAGTICLVKWTNNEEKSSLDRVRAFTVGLCRSLTRVPIGTEITLDLIVLSDGTIDYYQTRYIGVDRLTGNDNVQTGDGMGVNTPAAKYRHFRFVGQDVK